MGEFLCDVIVGSLTAIFLGLCICSIIGALLIIVGLIIYKHNKDGDSRRKIISYILMVIGTVLFAMSVLVIAAI